jgi:hypothetical protein
LLWLTANCWVLPGFFTIWIFWQFWHFWQFYFAPLASFAVKSPVLLWLTANCWVLPGFFPILDFLAILAFLAIP